MGLPDMVINDLEAYICSDGVRLREYARIQAQGDPDTKVCNIISQAGKEFEIYVNDLQPRRGKHKAIWIRVFAEGRLIAENGMLRGRTNKPLRIRSAKDEEGVARRLLFTLPRFIESDSAEPEEFLDQVGLLEVVVHSAKFQSKKAKRKYPTSLFPTNTPQVNASAASVPPAIDGDHTTDEDDLMSDENSLGDIGVLTERSKKQGFNIVTLGDPIHRRPAILQTQPCRPSAKPNASGNQIPKQSGSCTGAQKNDFRHWTQYTWKFKHLACFRFRHKSREMLEAAGVVPARRCQTTDGEGSDGSDGEGGDADHDDGVLALNDTLDEEAELDSDSQSGDDLEEFLSDLGSDSDSDSSTSSDSDSEAETLERMDVDLTVPDEEPAVPQPYESEPTDANGAQTESVAVPSYKQLAIDEIKVILTEAQGAGLSFKWPRYLDHASSGDLIPGTAHNTPVLAHKETLERLLCRLDGIESNGESDIQVSRKAAVVEIQRALDGYDNVIKRMKNLYLSRNPLAPPPPPTRASSDASLPSAVENANDPTMKDPPSAPSTSPLAPRSPGVAPVPSVEDADKATVSDPPPAPSTTPSPAVQPSHSSMSPGDSYAVAGTKRKHDAGETGLKPEVEEDVKPIIKPDPDAPAPEQPRKKRLSSKMKMLLAKQALLEEEEAQRQGRVELARTRLEIVEAEEAEEARKRSRAIDLTLDDD